RFKSLEVHLGWHNFEGPLSPKKTIPAYALIICSWPVGWVPKGHVWIQGDNLYVSRDSRHFGPLPYGLIEGKVFMRVSTANSIAFGFVHKNEL
ncbi:hypothetical protein Golax_001200, partial [Gossypium laxum]|nr:hypothetical protein [Gossypium laxum]